MFTNRIRTAEQLICQRGLFFAALMKVENRYRSLLMALEDSGGRLGYYTENENKFINYIQTDESRRAQVQVKSQHNN